MRTVIISLPLFYTRIGGYNIVKRSNVPTIRVYEFGLNSIYVYIIQYQISTTEVIDYCLKKGKSKLIMIIQ